MLKQVILVPIWLGMSPGKVISQCCHVAARLWPTDVTRIVVRVETKAEMDRLWRKAGREPYVHRYRFRDSAPTTEGTAGKITAIGFSGHADVVDRVTGHLRLY